MRFEPMETRPTEEHRPFLVLRHGNSVADFLIQQVTVYEGQLYPDELNGAIDWDDRVTDAIGWCAIGPIRMPETLDHSGFRIVEAASND